MQNLEKRYKKDLQRVNEKIDSILEEAMKVKRCYENETRIRRHSLGAGSSRQASISCRSTVVGFDDDLLEMKARLCGESLKLQIISIVGMGGIGKTTLAKTIFDDSLVVYQYHFDIRAWVTISQEYCMHEILLCLLSSLSAMSEDLSKKSDEILAEHVYKKGRRFLVIMDDMWSTKAWDDIRRILPDDDNGNHVLITTRLSEVAIYVDYSSPLHQVQLLNIDQSWSLLQKKVFENELCPKELEKIGKMIAGKCGGIPLAVVLVAGLLSKVDATLNYWEEFAENVSSTMERNDEHLFKILSLSYNNLGHHLRACFLYMGSFPEDSEIPILKLTMLWTAEGFLKPNTTKNSEEVVEESVIDLVKRNVILVTKKRSNGRFRFCRIHDLLREKANEDNFLHVNKIGNASQNGTKNTRRLCNFVNCSIPTETSCSFVRSILFSKKDLQYPTSLAISYRLLRVLDGPKVRSTCIPAAVTNLFHLGTLLSPNMTLLFQQEYLNLEIFKP